MELWLAAGLVFVGGAGLGASLAYFFLEFYFDRKEDVLYRRIHALKVALRLVRTTYNMGTPCVRCARPHVVTQNEKTLTLEFCHECLHLMDFSGLQQNQ